MKHRTLSFGVIGSAPIPGAQQRHFAQVLQPHTKESVMRKANCRKSLIEQRLAEMQLTKRDRRPARHALREAEAIRARDDPGDGENCVARRGTPEARVQAPGARA